MATTPAKVRFLVYFDYGSNYSFLSLFRLINRPSLPPTSHPTLLPPTYLITSQQLAIEYRPIVLGSIFKNLNSWEKSPYVLYPAKANYLWRDFERQCQRYGIIQPNERYTQPTVFPRQSLNALRIACTLFPVSSSHTSASIPATHPVSSHLASHPTVAERLGCAFTLRVFETNFLQDRDINDPSFLTTIVRDIIAETPGATSEGEDPAAVADRVMAAAQSQPIKDLLRAYTDEAVRHGVFGGPTFVVFQEGREEAKELFWGNDRLDEALEWAERLVLEVGNTDPVAGAPVFVQ